MAKGFLTEVKTSRVDDIGPKGSDHSQGLNRCPEVIEKSEEQEERLLWAGCCIYRNLPK